MADFKVDSLVFLKFLLLSQRDEEGRYVLSVRPWVMRDLEGIAKVFKALMDLEVIVEIKFVHCKASNFDDVEFGTSDQLVTDSSFFDDPSNYLFEMVGFPAHQTKAFVVIDQGRVDSYLSEVILEWKSGNFRISNQNYFKPEKQLQVVVSSLLQMIADFGEEGLLLKEFEESICLILLLLFLEKEGLIKIGEVQIGKLFSFRIDLLEKFSEFFKVGVDYDSGYFNSVINPELRKDVLVYSFTDGLEYKGKVKSFQGGGAPLALLNLAYESEDRTFEASKVIEITHAKDLRAVRKAVNNLNASLRGSLGIPDDWKVCRVVGEKVVFDSEIIHFKTK